MLQPLLGKDLVLSYKKLHILLHYDPARPLLGIDPREMKHMSTRRCVHKCSQNFIHDGQGRETAWFPPTGGWISKLQHIHTVEYYLVIKRNELFIQATTWIFMFFNATVN